MRRFAWNSTRRERRSPTNSTVGWRTNCGTLNSPRPRRSRRRARTCTKILTSCATVCLSIWPTGRLCRVSPCSTSRTLTAVPICGEIRPSRSALDQGLWVSAVASPGEEEPVAKISSTVAWAKIANFPPAVSILSISVWHRKVQTKVHYLKLYSSLIEI